MKDKLEDCLIVLNFHAKRIGLWNRFRRRSTSELKEAVEKLTAAIREASQHFEHGIIADRDELRLWLNKAESALFLIQKQYPTLR